MFRTSATPTEFAAAMSTLASGVVLVTTRVDGRPWGMTATAFASVSADPPTVLISLGAGTASARAIAETGSFGVSILAEDQVCLAAHGAEPGRPKFLDGLPEIAEALAHLDCDVAGTIEVADHIVFFGRVRRASLGADGDPLLYHGRDYRSLAPTDERTLRCLAS